MATSKKTILVVDDEANYLEAVRSRRSSSSTSRCRGSTALAREKGSMWLEKPLEVASLLEAIRSHI